MGKEEKKKKKTRRRKRGKRKRRRGKRTEKQKQAKLPTRQDLAPVSLTEKLTNTYTKNHHVKTGSSKCLLST